MQKFIVNGVLKDFLMKGNS